MLVSIRSFAGPSFTYPEKRADLRVGDLPDVFPSTSVYGDCNAAAKPTNHTDLTAPY